MIQLPPGFNASALVADFFACALPVLGCIALIAGFVWLARALGKVGG